MKYIFKSIITSYIKYSVLYRFLILILLRSNEFEKNISSVLICWDAAILQSSCWDYSILPIRQNIVLHMYLCCTLNNSYVKRKIMLHVIPMWLFGTCIIRQTISSPVFVYTNTQSMPRFESKVYFLMFMFKIVYHAFWIIDQNWNER